MKKLTYIAPIAVAICLFLSAIYHILLLTTVAAMNLGGILLGKNWILIGIPLHLCGLGILTALLVGLLLRKKMAAGVCIGLFILAIISTSFFLARGDRGSHVLAVGQGLSWLGLGILWLMFRRQMFASRSKTKESPNKASDATSGPAPSAGSSAHQG